MEQIVTFIIILLINTFVLYIVTNKFMILDNASFLKALIITSILSLFNLLISVLVGNPKGFHAEMFSGLHDSREI